MRTIESGTITEKVRDAFIKANYTLNESLYNKIAESAEKETGIMAKKALELVLQNSAVAKEINTPICQDTGMAVVFAEIGQDVHITGDLFADAVNEGVRRAYKEGYMRLSVVGDPFNRKNTEDNTPAVLHTNIVKGDHIKIICVPKGAGSENMSALKMFNPSAGRDDVIDFTASVVQSAGSKPCPPLVVGIGVGGNFEYAPILAKKALLREVGTRHEDEYYDKLEQDILARLNDLGIGAQGFGGDITALAVHICAYPTHIASLPVAVNISCHVARHETIII